MAIDSKARCSKASGHLAKDGELYVKRNELTEFECNSIATIEYCEGWNDVKGRWNTGTGRYR